MNLKSERRASPYTFLIYDIDTKNYLALVMIVEEVPGLANATVVPDLTSEEAKAINQLLKIIGINSTLRNNFISTEIEKRESGQVEKRSIWLAGWKMGYAESKGDGTFSVTIDKEFKRFKDTVEKHLLRIERCEKVVFS